MMCEGDTIVMKAYPTFVTYTCFASKNKPYELIHYGEPQVIDSLHQADV